MRINEPDATKHKPAPAARRRARPTSSAAPTRSRTPKTAAKEPETYPGDEAIRNRAYAYYVERGGASGDPMADWLRAERELIAERLAGEGQPAVRKTRRTRA